MNNRKEANLESQFSYRDAVFGSENPTNQVVIAEVPISVQPINEEPSELSDQDIVDKYNARAKASDRAGVLVVATPEELEAIARVYRLDF